MVDSTDREIQEIVPSTCRSNVRRQETHSHWRTPRPQTLLAWTMSHLRFSSFIQKLVYSIQQGMALAFSNRSFSPIAQL